MLIKRFALLRQRTTKWGHLIATLSLFKAHVYSLLDGKYLKIPLDCVMRNLSAKNRLISRSWPTVVREPCVPDQK
jgi:hypothetical protein